ncbi:MAG: D-alanine--D-alanine ligase [Deltaproteobacteria bacterium]|nr:D-alanine--D-alanine ligase [Deltaproteobacteria bacterium]MBW2308306.1 D-alanine--D-alanine ligase [Deltaproteobacteria bacterium]
MQRRKILKVGVLMGGISAEREVSLNTGRCVIQALEQRGYEVIPVDVREDVAARLVGIKMDAAFNALHGKFGEDGGMQGLLEILRIPYTGSGVLASALAMDKVFSRQIFRQQGLPVPESVVLSTGSFDPGEMPPGPSWVVKPSREGSSVGVTIVKHPDQMDEARELAFRYDREILVEQYIDGREISVGVLDDRAMGAIEIIPRLDEFYSYQAKYADGGSDHVFPAPLDRLSYERACRLALDAHRSLRCEGTTRVDMMMDKKGEFYILEVNTLPGMTTTSLIPEIARGAGITFDELCHRLVQGARLKIGST